MSNPYLSQIERGREEAQRRDPVPDRQGPADLRRDAVRAGRDPRRARTTGDVVAAVLADPTIGERHKRVLLDMYESFRAEHAAEVPPAKQPPATKTAAKKAATKKAASRRSDRQRRPPPRTRSTR